MCVFNSFTEHTASTYLNVMDRCENSMGFIHMPMCASHTQTDTHLHMKDTRRRASQRSNNLISIAFHSTKFDETRTTRIRIIDQSNFCRFEFKKYLIR